jgi:hypothetical protein
METSMTLELRKFVAPEIITGLGARLLVGRYIAHFAAKKPMIVTDKTVAGLPWFQELLQVVKESSAAFIVFDGTTPNPRDSDVMRGAELFSARNAICSSPSGAAARSTARRDQHRFVNGGSILDYEGVDEVDLPARR